MIQLLIPKWHFIVNSKDPIDGIICRVKEIILSNAPFLIKRSQVYILTKVLGKKNGQMSIGILQCRLLVEKGRGGKDWEGSSDLTDL